MHGCTVQIGVHSHVAAQGWGKNSTLCSVVHVEALPPSVDTQCTGACSSSPLFIHPNLDAPSATIARFTFVIDLSR